MRRSWGSITRLGTNRYRLRWWANGDDGYRRRTEIVHGTRKQASDRLAAIRVEHTNDAPVPTIGMVWENWVLPDKERSCASGQLSANTLRQYRSTWRRHVEPRWASVPCDAVRPLEVQGWLDTMARPAATAALSLARQVLNYAVRFMLVESNRFALGYRLPPVGDSHRDKAIWTLSELCDLWRTTIRDTWFEPSFILCAFGGCRVGESLGVLASEVEVKEVGGLPVALVPIRRQVTSATLTDKLKTRASERTVIVCGDPALSLAATAADGRYWLVDDGCGAPATALQVNRSWQRVMPPDDIHPYRNLRNAWQTYMRWELLVEPWLIETLMGHSTAGVTGQYYDRPSVEQMARNVVKAYQTLGTRWDISNNFIVSDLRKD